MVGGMLQVCESAGGGQHTSDSWDREQKGNCQNQHSSNVIAGSQGCVVMIFPRASLLPFLDTNPGVLLSLLGTQVIV